MIREASCVCAGLKIRLEGDPSYVSSCCCQACQRRTGAPFGVTAFFAAEQLIGQDGEARTYRRIADSGAALDFHFCPTCGATVWWDGRPGRVAVAAGAFADKDFPAPQRMIWTEHRADWVRPPEGVPEFVGPPD